jgi:hypothetical protein
MRVLGLLGVKGSGKDTMGKYLIDNFGFERIGYADELYKQVAAAYSTTTACLNRRDTKETELPFLSLDRCRDVQFVEVALQALVRTSSLRKACLHFYATGKSLPHVAARRVRQVMQSSRSPRWTLQIWGTEYRRTGKYGVDAYWLDIVAAQIAKRPAQRFVITDVRFINEARFVEHIGGDLMRVRRPAIEEKEAAERATKGTAAHPSEVELLTYSVPFEVINIEGDPDSLKKGFDSFKLLALA